MKLSNFKLIDDYGDKCDKVSFATIDVTTTKWFRKKTETKEIFNKHGNWYFVETGEFTPGFIVEGLESATRAKMIREKHEKAKQ